MNPILRNVLAVVGGVIIGSLVNMAILIIGSYIIPVPEGMDMMNAESIKEHMHLFQFKHFVFPFLAHALGTLVGAFVAAKFGVVKPLQLAILVGVFFLAGGIANIKMIPSPVWFTVVDVVLAYIPMAWIGYTLAKRS